ncbi:MAG: ribonuclease [Pseudomonadota bacterium]
MNTKSLSGIGFLLLLAIVAALLELNSEQGIPGNDQVAEDYILAVNWQPAFCESRPNKPECRSQRAGRFDTAHFSLHGLWPQPRDNTYCGVDNDIIDIDTSGRWHRLPDLQLSDRVRDELAEKMPGYRSHLHRHEWIKHGTCMQQATAEQYYEVSLSLLDQLNASAVSGLFAGSIGKRLDEREIEQAFQRAFGKAAPSRVVLDCYRDDGRRLFVEIKLSLSGNLLLESDLKTLINAGKKLGRSCPSGLVDAVGLQ